MANLTYQEAVTLIEKYGIKVSLAANNIETLRSIAQVIADLEARLLAAGLKLSFGFSLADLKDGDILILKSEQPVTQEQVSAIAQFVRSRTGDKKIGVWAFEDDQSIEVLTEAERERILHMLAPELKANKDRFEKVLAITENPPAPTQALKDAFARQNAKREATKESHVDRWRRITAEYTASIETRIGRGLTPAERYALGVMTADEFPGTDSGELIHCDATILHSPGVCKYCDQHPSRQEARRALKVAFSNEQTHPEGGSPCISGLLRDPVVRDLWHGNRAYESPNDLGKALAEREEG